MPLRGAHKEAVRRGLVDLWLSARMFPPEHPAGRSARHLEWYAGHVDASAREGVRKHAASLRKRIVELRDGIYLAPIERLELKNDYEALEIWEAAERLFHAEGWKPPRSWEPPGARSGT